MRTWPLIASFLLTALPAAADTVYLTNGGSFEGVMAEVSGSKVTIRMQSGTLSLPLTQVARIDSSDSTLGQFLVRKQDLQRSGASAAAWIELSAWAQSKGLSQASRETALAAARIDPKASGLADLMRQHGYVFDEAASRWITYDDSMRLRGFVQSNGQWIARSQYEAEERQRQAEVEQRHEKQLEAQRAAREERLAQLTELALAREASQRTAPVIVAQPYIPQVYVMPGYFFPPVIAPPPQDNGGTPPTPPNTDPRPRETPRTTHSTFTRVPGSLIPGDYPSSTPYQRPNHRH